MARTYPTVKTLAISPKGEGEGEGEGKEAPNWGWLMILGLFFLATTRKK